MLRCTCIICLLSDTLYDISRISASTSRLLRNMQTYQLGVEIKETLFVDSLENLLEFKEINRCIEGRRYYPKLLGLMDFIIQLTK